MGDTHVAKGVFRQGRVVIMTGDMWWSGRSPLPGYTFVWRERRTLLAYGFPGGIRQ